MRLSLLLLLAASLVNCAIALTNSPCPTNCSYFLTDATVPCLTSGSPGQSPANTNDVNSLCPVMADTNTPWSQLTNGPVSYPGCSPMPINGPGWYPWMDSGCGQLWIHREIRQDCSQLARQKPAWLATCPGGDPPLSGGGISNPDYDMWGDDWQPCYDVLMDRTAHPLDFLMMWLRHCTLIDNGPNYWPEAVVTESAGSPASNVEPLLHVAIGEDGMWGEERSISWVTNGVLASWYDTSNQRMWGMRLPGEDYPVLCGSLKYSIPAKSAKLIGCPFNTENITLDWIFSRAITNSGTNIHVDGILPGGAVFLTLVEDDATNAHWVPFQYVNTTEPEINQWFPEGGNNVATFVAGSGGIIINPLDEVLEFELAGYLLRENWEQPIPAGWSVVSALNGLPGYMITDLGFPYDNATVVRLVNTNSEWDQYTVTNGVWSPTEPYLDWGAAAMVYQSSAKTWYQSGIPTPEPVPDIALFQSRNGNLLYTYGQNLVPGLHYTLLHSEYLYNGSSYGWHTNSAFTATSTNQNLFYESAFSGASYYRLREDITERRSQVIGQDTIYVPAGGTKWLANQFDRGDNTLATIFTDADVPNGTIFYDGDSNSDTFYYGYWSDGTQDLSPGIGFKIEAPGFEDVWVPVYGDVLEGTFNATMYSGDNYVALAVPLYYAALNVYGYGWPNLPDVEDLFVAVGTSSGSDNYYWDTAMMEWDPSVPVVFRGYCFVVEIEDTQSWSYSYTVTTP